MSAIPHRFWRPLPAGFIEVELGRPQSHVYGTGDIPVGAYASTRLASIGIGHGAVDGGAGFKYLNPTNGRRGRSPGLGRIAVPVREFVRGRRRLPLPPGERRQ